MKKHTNNVQSPSVGKLPSTGTQSQPTGMQSSPTGTQLPLTGIQSQSGGTQSPSTVPESKSGGKAVRTVAVMMGVTVISKLLGMLRTTLQANVYGTTAAANAFTAASKLPLTFFDMLLSAAVIGCFIPAYNSFVEKKKNSDGSEGDTVTFGSLQAEADRFAAVFLTFLLLLCGLLAAVGMIFAPFFIRLIAPNLDVYASGLAVTMTRILFPLVIFAGATYTLIGVLQSHGSFIVPAMISAVSNAGVVVYLLICGRRASGDGIVWLAVAYLLSWFVQLLTLLPPLHRCGFPLRLCFDFRNPTLRRSLKAVPPIMVGSWLAPMGTLLGQYFASRIGVDGATTVFDIANNIYVILAGTLTYSICNYTFPKLAKLAAARDREGFSESVKNGIESALLIILPFMAAALVLAPEGVSILYLHGEFTPTDAANTTAALLPLIAAMPFFAVIELFCKVFYSQNRVKIPMYAALCGIAANFLTGTLFALFVPSDSAVGGNRMAMVGISNAVGQACAALVLCIALRRTADIFDKAFFVKLTKILFGSLAVFAVCLGMKTLVHSTPYEAGFFVNVIKACIIFLPSVILYVVYAKAVGLSFGRKS